MLINPICCHYMPHYIQYYFYFYQLNHHDPEGSDDLAKELLAQKCKKSNKYLSNVIYEPISVNVQIFISRSRFVLWFVMYFVMYFIICIFISLIVMKNMPRSLDSWKKKEIDAMSCSVLFDHPLGMGWSLKLYHSVVTWNLTVTLWLHSISVTLTMKSFRLIESNFCQKLVSCSDFNVSDHFHWIVYHFITHLDHP